MYDQPKQENQEQTFQHARNMVHMNTALKTSTFRVQSRKSFMVPYYSPITPGYQLVPTMDLEMHVCRYENCIRSCRHSGDCVNKDAYSSTLWPQLPSSLQSFRFGHDKSPYSLLLTFPYQGSTLLANRKIRSTTAAAFSAFSSSIR